MPNIKSSKQDVLKSRERRLLNQMHKGRMKGGIRRARLAISGGKEDAAGAVREAVSVIDRAAARGAIHRNAADRRKSRLARRLNAATRAAAS